MLFVFEVSFFYIYIYIYIYCPNLVKGQELFIFSTILRQAVGPTQPPFQWALGAFSLVAQGPVHEPTECT
jgi:hypothetical protein